MADATKVLSGFNSTILNKILKHENIMVAQEDPKKSHLVESIQEHVEHIGFNLLLDNLSKEELEKACKHSKVDLGEAKNPSKQLMKKRLSDQVREVGLGKFLDKFGDSSDLVSVFADTVGIEEEVKDSKKGIKEVAKEISAVGLESLLNRFDLPFLKTMAEDAGLNANTLNKARVVKSIITGKNVKAPTSSEHKERLEKQQKEAEKAAAKIEKRPDIKKGITYQEMFQCYLRSELFDYCKNNGLKVSGKKPDLIKRIIAWHDGDTENTVATPKTARKEGEKKEKKPAAKKASPKKAAPKEKESAKETAKEGEAASTPKGTKKGTK